jgi:hypothetical protein
MELHGFLYLARFKYSVEEAAAAAAAAAAALQRQQEKNGKETDT